MSTAEEDIPEDSRHSSREERKKKKKMRRDDEEQQSLRSSASHRHHHKKKKKREEGSSRSSSRHRSSRQEEEVVGAQEGGSSSLSSRDKKKKKKKKRPSNSEEEERAAAEERRAILDKLESKAASGTLSTIASVSTVQSTLPEDATLSTMPEDATLSTTQPDEVLSSSREDESTTRSKKKKKKKPKTKEESSSKTKRHEKRSSSQDPQRQGRDLDRNVKIAPLPKTSHELEEGEEEQDVKVGQAGADESMYYGDESIIQQVAPPIVSTPQEFNAPQTERLRNSGIKREESPIVPTPKEFNASQTERVRSSGIKRDEKRRGSSRSEKMFTVKKGTGGKQWTEEEAMGSFGSNQDFSAVSHSSGFSMPASSRAVRSKASDSQRVGAYYEATMPDRIQSMIDRKFNELDEGGQQQDVGAHHETDVPGRLQSMMDRKFNELGQSQQGFLSASAEATSAPPPVRGKLQSHQPSYVKSSTGNPHDNLHASGIDDTMSRRDLAPAAINFSMWNTGPDKNTIATRSPDVIADRMMDDQEMALSGVERKEARLSAGLCPDCGKTKTHEKIKYGPFQAFRKMEPLTTPGHVYKGYCLFCNTLQDLRRHLHEPYLREQDVDGTKPSLLTDKEAAKVAAMYKDDSDKDLDFARKKRRTQICLCVAVLAVIASGIFIAIKFVGNDDGSSGNAVVAASPPTPAPGPIGWYQLGSDITKPIQSFGYKVSISDSGHRVAVASPKAKANAGSVDVFEYFNTTKQWETIGLPIVGDSEDDLAGYSIKLSADGNHVIVGYPGNDSGFVRVFRFSDGEWKQLGSIIRGENTSGWFGAAVFITAKGKSIVVGAPYETNERGSEAGRVRVFVLEGGDWVQLGNDLLGRAALDHFGTSVSLSNDDTKLAVGAPNNDDRWQDGGQVHVYMLRNDNEGNVYWKESLKTLKILGDEEGHAFGSAMSMCGYGDTIVSSSVVATNDQGTVGGGDPRVVYVSFIDDVADELGYGFPEIPGTLGLGNAVDIDLDGTKVVLATLNLEKQAGKAMVYDIAGKANWYVFSDEYGGQALGPDEWLGNGPSVALAGPGNHFAIGFESIVVNSASKETAPIVRVYYYGPEPQEEDDESES